MILLAACICLSMMQVHLEHNRTENNYTSLAKFLSVTYSASYVQKNNNIFKPKLIINIFIVHWACFFSQVFIVNKIMFVVVFRILKSPNYGPPSHERNNSQNPLFPPPPRTKNRKFKQNIF
jgi:hypothetical protein